MNKLEELRAKLAQLESKSSGNNSNGDTALYKFWDLNENESSLLRFLPDGDQDNVFFWVERQMIKLEFPGVLGGDEKKKVFLSVPCGEMYGDVCPVLTEVRPWFKDPSLEDMGRKYWKKRSYIFQGFVVEDGLKEDAENVPENPIRRYMISPQVFSIIKAALMDPDMENLPTDYLNGTDFRVSKTTKGQYADWNTSKWARKERSLSEEEMAAIDEHGLANLGDFLPARPTADHYAAILEMFEASVNGELYDPNRWGNYYKPYGIEVPGGAPQPGLQQSSASAQKTSEKVKSPSTAVTEETTTDIPWVDTVQEAAVQEEKPKPELNDLLASIRSRASANKE